MKSLTHQFLDFCRSKPAGETFDGGNNRRCAGYQFLSTQGLPVSVCLVSTWFDQDNNLHFLPEPIYDALLWAYYEPVPTFGALADRLEQSLSPTLAAAAAREERAA